MNSIFSSTHRPLGPPGCGKTLLAKALANESDAVFISVTASTLTSKWLGDPEKLAKALFAVLRYLKPAILFIDEIDSLLSQRNDSPSADGMARFKAEILIEMDGLSSSNEGLLVVGATNLPHLLDEAFRRRLEKKIFIDLPDLRSREVLIAKLLSKRQSDSLTAEETSKLANLTDGYSSCDIVLLEEEAARRPIRDLVDGRFTKHIVKQLKSSDARKITFEDFIYSLEKVKPNCDAKSIAKMVDWNKKHGNTSR